MVVPTGETRVIGGGGRAFAELERGHFVAPELRAFAYPELGPSPDWHYDPSRKWDQNATPDVLPYGARPTTVSPPSRILLRVVAVAGRSVASLLSTCEFTIHSPQRTGGHPSGRRCVHGRQAQDRSTCWRRDSEGGSVLGRLHQPLLWDAFHPCSILQCTMLLLELHDVPFICQTRWAVRNLIGYG